MSAVAPSEALVRESEQVLATHARSFRWAAPFLPPPARRDAAVAYAFCRLVDDLCDEAPSQEVAKRELAALSDELVGKAPARPLVAAYHELEARRGIEPRAARDLVAGVVSDLERVRVGDDEELERYCYRVAGTVGLMMAGILDARQPERARGPAMDLGMGMQLTNICRDVKEDAGRDRVYLPATRLLAHGVSHEDVLAGRAPAKVYAVVQELLERAEGYYASADAGMRYLPPRARLAIYVAARLYRAIGRRVLRAGPSALATRTVVPPVEKLGWCLAALAAFCGLTRLRP